MRYLLDTDILCFKSATAAEQEYYWGEDDIWTLLMDMDDARDAFQSHSNRFSKPWVRLTFCAVSRTRTAISEKMSMQHTKAAGGKRASQLVMLHW